MEPIRYRRRHVRMPQRRPALLAAAPLSSGGNDRCVGVIVRDISVGGAGLVLQRRTNMLLVPGTPMVLWMPLDNAGLEIPGVIVWMDGPACEDSNLGMRLLPWHAEGDAPQAFSRWIDTQH